MIRSTLNKSHFLLPVLLGMSLSAAALAQVPAVKPVPGTAPPPAPAPTAVQAAPAASPAAPAAENADSLLKRVDAQLNAFTDAKFEFKLVIKESTGNRELTFSTLQKGPKRLVRFLGGDGKGMAILVESPESMYAMLPEFNNRIRRIGSHQVSQSFMGSDVNSDDMSMVEFSSAYAPKLIGSEGEKLILELNLRPGKQAAFPRIKMWVESKRALIARLEYMDASGKKLRTQLREEYKQDSEGATPHWSPGRMTFIDHVRNNHESQLILQKSQVNIGLQDNQFNQRALVKDN